MEQQKLLPQTRACKKCGIITDKYYEHIGTKDGFILTCKTCIRQQAKLRPRTLNTAYYQYSQNAKHRGYKFNLTLEEFKAYWKKDCFYCGNQINTVGIDRIINAQGYNPNNCVACCKICNRAKGTLNPIEFIQHCEQVSKRAKNIVVN